MKTKRKITVGLLVLMFTVGIIWVNTAFAFPNEPIGYLNYNWGTPASKMASILGKKIKSIEEINIDVYDTIRKHEGERRMMMFLDGKIAAITILFEHRAAVETTAQALLAVFGPPTTRTSVSAIWQGEITTIEFAPSKRTLIIGSTTGLSSLDALIEWHNANTKKQAI